MARQIAMAAAAALLVTGVAHAQSGTSAPGPATLGDDTSRSAGNERNQQFALDHIRDELDTNNPEGKKARKRAREPIVAATAADFAPGTPVYDMTGQPLGTIELVNDQGVQLKSDTSRAMVPADVFGKKGGQLMLNVRKSEFEKLAGSAK
ncbi:hypothetical protein GCM10011380_11610 [Sphingomonas metalli]|uniref:PRC-barrel domain-containing protein n=1 Tax=Sphingomonas metalli TaxID=1779358 RepID=A0A916WRH4_9SPHN|nr:hypothetical protein [Sphingomonas metalli]GGB23560.1 hypothetical protein GCM10011380_11610 [Sphingomonas metalli]